MSKTRMRLIPTGRGIAVREYPRDIGPAEYVSFVDRRVVGVIEAKPKDRGHKITTAEDQAEGYATAALKWVKNKEQLPFVYDLRDLEWSRGSN